MANHRTRIQLHDAISDVFFKLSEGNPRALTVLMEIWKQHKDIDPYCDPIMCLLFFDTLGIYGSRIWILYKDVCGENISKTIAMTRAVQMGVITEEALNHDINNYWEKKLDMADIFRKLLVQLPNFKINEK